MAAKKTAGKPVNKSAFVRSLPMTMSAKDVIAKGKAQGITLSEDYVYGVRSKSRAGKAKRPVALKAQPAPGGRTPFAEAIRVALELRELVVSDRLTAQERDVLQKTIAAMFTSGL